MFDLARELCPCIVLLDNIDMLLGASAAQEPPETAGNTGTAGNAGKAGKVTGNGTTHRSTRTRHHAVDRMLSTLLVEIDGIYTTTAATPSTGVSGTTATTTSTSTTTAVVRKAGGGSAVLKAAPSVLVVVTTTSMNCLDR